MAAPKVSKRAVKTELWMVANWAAHWAARLDDYWVEWKAASMEPHLVDCWVAMTDVSKAAQ